MSNYKIKHIGRGGLMKSIRQKLIIYTLILVAAPIIISNVASQLYLNWEYDKELEQSNTELADALSEQVMAFIDKGYASQSKSHLIMT